MVRTARNPLQNAHLWYVRPRTRLHLRREASIILLPVSSPSKSTLDLARALLREEDDLAAAKTLLNEILAMSGADRGFVVVRDGGEFVSKFEVSTNSQADDDEGRFSRALVRTVLDENAPIYSMNPVEDPRLAQTASVMAAAGRAVLVVPLSSGEQRFGALYVEHPRVGGFTDAARQVIVESAELAGLVLHRAVQRAELARRSSELEASLLAQFNFAGIVTRDPAMLQVLKTIAQVAPAKASVLVRGESGTGKELVARAIHLNGPRSSAPFVAVHCAALPGSMLESELFGHIKGAFTGADRDRAGRLASANKGTLFLDEIGELPVDVQAKLLRAIQFGELQRVGSDKVERVDVRIVAATHRDLFAMTKTGAFREDLYYRLRVVEIGIPPLRERRGDVGIIVNHFVKAYSAGRQRRLTGRALLALENYSWPGNVRELANAIERACLLAASADIDLDDLPREITTPAREAPRIEMQSGMPGLGRLTRADLERARTELENRFAQELLAQHNGDLERAAHASGIDISELRSMQARPASERNTIARNRELQVEVSALERKRILETLESCAGNQTAAAERLGISRRTLINRLAEFNIQRPRRRS